MNLKPHSDPEKIISRLDEIRQVEPSPFLLAKIRYKIGERKKETISAWHLPIWKPIAAFTLLLVLNATVLYFYNKSTENNNEMAISTEEIGSATDLYYESY